MARYMGGPRGRREATPPLRSPSPRTDQDMQGNAEECGSSDPKNSEEELPDDQGDCGLLQKILIHQSIEIDNDEDNIEGAEDSHSVSDESSIDSTDESGVQEAEYDEMSTGEDSTLRRTQHRGICGPALSAPMFPKLPISSRNIGYIDESDDPSLAGENHSTSSRTSGGRQRTPSPGIDIEYINPNSSGKFIFEPPPLSISYGWMAKGTNEHVEDLHLSGVMFCDAEVQSENEIEVLCEYTWIEAAPDHEQAQNTLRAIYVPGNTRNWKGLQLGSSLKQADLCDVAARTVRDEHAILQSQYPYEPTFRALEALNTDISLENIDIVTDVDTLTKLLAFICGPRASETPITESFRLDLSSVRNTLFIIPKEKPGRGYTGPLRKQERTDPTSTVPQWAAPVLSRMGSDDPELPYSGGHYRLVRYRFGNLLLAVRVKVDFVHENHDTQAISFCEGPDAAMTGSMSASMPPHEDPIGKTTVNVQGPGTEPDATGTTTVRYNFQRPMSKLNKMMPQLWFSRTRFLVEGVVDHPTLEIQDASIIESQQYYKSFERGHRCSLRHLAGLLRHLQRRTCELGGNTVVICDPMQVCFVVLKPVIKTSPVPDDIILRFWGPEDSFIPAWRLEKAASPGSESDLTDLGTTPTPPRWSDLADIGRSSKCHNVENQVPQDGNSITNDVERVTRADSVGVIEDWRADPPHAEVQDEGYEPDIEDNISSTFTGGDGYTTDTDDNSITMGGSSSKIPFGPLGGSGEDLVAGRQQVGDFGSLLAGGGYQQEGLSEVRAAHTRKVTDEDSSDGPVTQMNRHHMDDSFDSDYTPRERMEVKSNGNASASEDADDGIPATGSQQEQRFSLSAPISSDTNLHGAATPYMD